MSLTNVPTLENFALILFFPVFGRNLVLTSALTSFSWHCICSPRSCGNSRLLGLSAVSINSVGTWWTCASIWMALSISVILYPFLLMRVSVARPCAGVDTHQSRSVVKFGVAQFMRILISFCIVVPATDMSRWLLISLIGRVVGLLVAQLWCGREITGESLRNLKIVIEHICRLIDSHRHRSIRTRVVHGSGARGRDFSMSSASTESQYGLRYVNGVPVWNREILTLRDHETATLWFRAGLKPGEQERVVARLWANLQGLAKEMVRKCRPQDFEDARGVERLLSILRDSPLASMPVADAYKKIQAHDQIRRRPGEVTGDYIVKRAACFPRDDRSSPTCLKVPKWENWSAVIQPGNSLVHSDAEYEMVEDEDILTEAPSQQEQTGQTFFELEIRGYRLLQNARLSREERQMVLAGTRNDTENSAIVTQLRSAWETKTSVTETEELRASERAARFILPKPTQNGMLNRLRTVSRVMQPS